MDPDVPLQIAHLQFLEATKEIASKRRLSYQKWMQGALQKGMGHLFKSLKKGEATILRPFRHLSPEARAFARAKQWAASWQGHFRFEELPSPSPDTSDLRDALKVRAKEQSSSLAPIPASFLKEKFSKCKSKAPGPDGWTYAILRKLTEPMLEDISSLYAENGARPSSPASIHLDPGVYVAQVGESRETHLLNPRPLEGLAPLKVESSPTLDNLIPRASAMGRRSSWQHLT